MRRPQGLAECRGPSPRARGTQIGESRAQPARRSIPACAGNTAPDAALLPRLPVHPRVRGEHATLAGAADGADRSIPACAGNTSRDYSTIPRVAVHPRVRGEHQASAPDYVDTDGPSPRARGTLQPLLKAIEARRSIPACAGNTASTWWRWAVSSVHPRVRGEHQRTHPLRDTLDRSIPACAGNTLWIMYPTETLRSIPACAGNTPARSIAARSPSGPSPRARGTRGFLRRWWRSFSVHPRVRGEHLQAELANLTPSGPSPRARGTRSLESEAGTVRAVHPRVRGEHRAASGRAWTHARSIPACAGNTPGLPHPPRSISVHPRVRGEHVHRPAQIEVLRRSIPACAGNTGLSNVSGANPNGPSPRARGTPPVA